VKKRAPVVERFLGWIEPRLGQLPMLQRVYAERDHYRALARKSFAMDLSQRIQASSAAVKMITSREPSERRWLFDALTEAGQTVALAEHGGLCFVVRLGDKYISRDLYATGQFEFDKVAVALALLKSRGQSEPAPNLLVDVGANIGSVCIPAVASGQFDRAIAIEPHPENVRLLRTNIALNGLTEKIDVVASAVADGPGKLMLSQSTDNWGDHRTWAGAENRVEIEVPCITLDSLDLAGERRHPLIWMDIQGAEGRALAGASELLRRRPPIVVEFWPWAIERAQCRAELFGSLSGYGRVYDLNKMPAGPQPASLEALWREIGIGEDKATDVLLLA